MAHEEVCEAAGTIVSGVVHGSNSGHGQTQTRERHGVDAVSEAVLRGREMAAGQKRGSVRHKADRRALPGGDEDDIEGEKKTVTTKRQIDIISIWPKTCSNHIPVCE